MKNIFLFLSVCLIFFSTSCTKNTNPQPPVHDTVTVIKYDTTKLTDTLYGSKPDTTMNLAKGLLLYLPFSGNILDSSGNGNITTAVNGGGLTYDAHGYANSAFGGNGYDQAILVANNGSIKFDTALTVSVDFMTTDLSIRHAFLTMVDYADGSGPSFGITTSVPGNPSLLDAGFVDASTGCSGYGPPIHPLNDTTALVPALGAWYNALVTYERGTVKVYVNGTLIGTKVTSSQEVNLCSDAYVVVGGWWSGDPIGVAGSLDNVRVYNRVLNAHEIAALAANYQPTSTRVSAPVLRGQ